MKKAPALCIYNHRSVKRPGRTVFRIGGPEMIEPLSQFGQISQPFLLIDEPIDTHAKRSHSNEAQQCDCDSSWTGDNIPHGSSSSLLAQSRLRQAGRSYSAGENKCQSS